MMFFDQWHWFCSRLGRLGVRGVAGVLVCLGGVDVSVTHHTFQGRLQQLIQFADFNVGCRVGLLQRSIVFVRRFSAKTNKCE